MDWFGFDFCQKKTTLFYFTIFGSQYFVFQSDKICFIKQDIILQCMDKCAT